jgi:hypothetical protein
MHISVVSGLCQSIQSAAFGRWLVHLTYIYILQWHSPISYIYVHKDRASVVYLSKWLYVSKLSTFTPRCHIRQFAQNALAGGHHRSQHAARYFTANTVHDPRVGKEPMYRTTYRTSTGRQALFYSNITNPKHDLQI